MMTPTKVLIWSAALLVGCASTAPPPPKAPPASRENLPMQIIAPHAEGNSRELFARGEALLAERKWAEAANYFNALLNANEPSAASLFPMATFDLGVAYEGMGERKEARDSYAHVASTYPDNAIARQAWFRILDQIGRAHV